MVAIDLVDMPNQPNSADNRRVSLVCPDAIDRKKKYIKGELKIQFDYCNTLSTINPFI